MTGGTVAAIAFGIIGGIAATATMDVLGIAAGKLGLVVGAKRIWVGRWYLGIAHDRFAHADITTAPEQPGEAAAALVGHHLIGIALAFVYILGATWLGLSPSGLPVALAYGLATCVFPWLLVFPALGFGWIGVRGPSELRLFTSSLLNHLFYGFGLWWAAELLPLG